MVTTSGTPPTLSKITFNGEHKKVCGAPVQVQPAGYIQNIKGDKMQRLRDLVDLVLHNPRGGAGDSISCVKENPVQIEKK